MGEDPRVGYVIEGRFRVIRFIGRGGMGAVYEGEHVELGKRVAVKFMHREGLEHEAMERFRREARAASRVNHPNVIQIYDAGVVEATGEMYIVMELIEGAADLRTVVAREGALAPPRAIAIATALLEGLHAIHEAGIVHRDIKPANVLVLADGAGVKIMDFGISKSVTTNTRLTQTGRVVGSPQFMAPEQILGTEIDRRADIYAAGVTVYQIIVGEVPFTELEYTKLVVRHLRDEVPSLADAKPGTPPAIVDAVARALQKDPAARFPTALAFAAALRRRASSVPPAARPSAPAIASGRPSAPSARPSAPGLRPSVPSVRPSAPGMPPPAAPTVPIRKRARRASSKSAPPPSHRTAWIVAGSIATAGAIALVLALTMHRGAAAVASAATVPDPSVRNPGAPSADVRNPGAPSADVRNSAGWSADVRNPAGPSTTVPTTAVQPADIPNRAVPSTRNDRSPIVHPPDTKPTTTTPAPGGGSGSGSGSGLAGPWVTVPTAIPLELASIPSGAHAWLDGKAVGEAPLRLEHVAVGKHVVHFALVGYQSEDVTVEIFSNQDVAYAKARLQLLVNPHADHRLNPY